MNEYFRAIKYKDTNIEGLVAYMRNYGPGTDEIAGDVLDQKIFDEVGMFYHGKMNWEPVLKVIDKNQFQIDNIVVNTRRAYQVHQVVHFEFVVLTDLPDQPEKVPVSNFVTLDVFYTITGEVGILAFPPQIPILNVFVDHHVQPLLGTIHQISRNSQFWNRS